MITIAIVDDEPHCVDRILALLQPYKNKIRVSVYETAETAIQGLDTLCPDIVFLDIQLHDKTGFDVLQAISHADYHLIFTTAYEQFAINAFKFSAMDYLLKPVDKEEFNNALQKAFAKIEKDQFTKKINVLLSHLSEGNAPKKICIPTTKGYIFQDIANIVRCQSDVNYTFIHTSDRQKHMVSKTLKHFEELLTIYGFYRIHNSHLINLAYVKAYAKSGYVTLTDTTILEVSHRRKEGFLKVLTKL